MANTDNSNRFWWVVSAAVLATVVGGLLLAVLLSDAFQKEALSFGSVVLGAGVWLFSAKLLLPVWLVLLVALLCIWSAIRLLYFMREAARRKASKYKTSFVHYRHDVIDGVAWSWNYNAKGEVINLVPACDNDGVLMHPESGKVTKSNFDKQVMVWLRCPSCRRTSSGVEGNNRAYIDAVVVKEIQRKIYKKEYLKLIAQKKPS